MKKKMVSVLLIFTSVIMLTGCGSLYSSHKSGYTEITAVSGVMFEMPENFLSDATAVTSISQDSDYEATETYLYKNGDSCYMLFNMNSVIVAVSTDTSYNLSESDDVDASITNSTLNGICFTPEDGSSYSYEESNKKDSYKIIADAVGDVTLTTELYGKYDGKFVYVESSGMECTMFVGANMEKYRKLSGSQEKLIEHIAKSLTITADEATGSDDQPSEDVSVMDSEDSQKETNISDPVTVEEEATETKAETESTKRENSGNEQSEQTFLHAESNQHEATGTASDFYHQLKIGDVGRLEALDGSGKELKSTFVIVNDLYVKDDADKIIREYCKTDECPYEYSAAPDGYSWHAIEYTLSMSPEDLYVDIKLEGLDGEKLKYRGVAASSMTHDIFYHMEKTEDGYSKLYCYYAVPNGCKEYTLEFGTRVEGENSTACYEISGF